MTPEQTMMALALLSVVISIVAIVWVAAVAGNMKSELEVLRTWYRRTEQDIESLESGLAACRCDVVRMKEREAALLAYLQVEFTAPAVQTLTVKKKEKTE